MGGFKVNSVITLISPMETLRGVRPLSLCGMDTCGGGGHWRNLVWVGASGRGGAQTVVTVEGREAHTENRHVYWQVQMCGESAKGLQ